MANFIKINNAANFNENNSTPSKKNLKKNKYHELVLNTNKKLTCNREYITANIIENINLVMADTKYNSYSKKYIHSIITKIFNKQDISEKEYVIINAIIVNCIGGGGAGYKDSIIYTDTKIYIIDKIFLHNFDEKRFEKLQQIINDTLNPVATRATITYDVNLLPYIKLSLQYQSKSLVSNIINSTGNITNNVDNAKLKLLELIHVLHDKYLCYKNLPIGGFISAAATDRSVVAIKKNVGEIIDLATQINGNDYAAGPPAVLFSGIRLVNQTIVLCLMIAQSAFDTATAAGLANAAAVADHVRDSYAGGVIKAIIDAAVIEGCIEADLIAYAVDLENAARTSATAADAIARLNQDGNLNTLYEEINGIIISIGKLGVREIKTSIATGAGNIHDAIELVVASGYNRNKLMSELKELFKIANTKTDVPTTKRVFLFDVEALTSAITDSTALFDYFKNAVAGGAPAGAGNADINRIISTTAVININKNDIEITLIRVLNDLYQIIEMLCRCNLKPVNNIIKSLFKNVIMPKLKDW